MNRRQFTQRVAGSLAAAVATNILAAEKQSSEPKQAPSADVKHIALLAYPQFTALDLVAPQHLLGAVHGSKLHVVAKTRDILVSDTGMRIQPNMTLHECPEDLFVIFVPGGTKGTLDAMQDPAIIEFLADRANRAQYVTSVCTGSLILGAAGLLNGYRATSHWLVRDKVLPLLGATPVAERVVRDRNRITGGGVTAGLDFALNIVNASEGEEYTKATQLMAEYDPQPPFDAGSPQKAGEGPTQLLSRIFARLSRKQQQLPSPSLAEVERAETRNIGRAFGVYVVKTAKALLALIVGDARHQRVVLSVPDLEIVRWRMATPFS